MLAVLVLAACEGDQIQRVSSTGFFNPTEVDFGVRTVGLGHELTTELLNTSADDLRVLEVEFDPPESAFAARLPENNPLRGALLAPSQRTTVTIFFFPEEARSYDTSMILVFNTFQIALPIRASAELIPPAAPALDPEQIAFSTVEVGRDVRQTLTITNDGDSDGTLKSIKGANAPFSVQRLGGGPVLLPSEVLTPGMSLDVEVHYRPTLAGHHEAAVELTFDSGQAAILQLSGDAVTPGTLACSGPIDFGSVPRGETRAMRVDCSVTGGPYTVGEVRFIEGSSNLFSIPNPPSGTLSGSFSFDVEFEAAGLAARHTGSIEVVAGHGVITRVNLAGDVEPPLPGTTDIRAVLEWNTPWSDFDLHLVREGGQPFDDENDCYFAHKNLDWGMAGYPGDDPFLDRDDIDGFGPEEVSITSIADAAPVYTVYVQYHHYSRDSAPPTSVTLDLQIRDLAPMVLTRDMITCGNLWHVGRIRFDRDPPAFELIDVEDGQYMGYAGEMCR